MNIILFDTETTGLLLPSKAPLDKQPRIIEVGCVKADETGRVLAELEQTLDPQCAVSAEITKITGLKQSDVDGQPTFAQFLPQLRAFFAGADMMVCHNAPFDTGMLRNELARCGCTDFPWPKEIVCSVAEYIPLFGFRPSLKVLHKRIMGVELAQTHRGLDDVKALLALLAKDKFFDKVLA